MPETDHTGYIRQAMIDSGFDPESFGLLDTGNQRAILEQARKLHTGNGQLQ